MHWGPVLGQCASHHHKKFNLLQVLRLMSFPMLTYLASIYTYIYGMLREFVHPVPLLTKQENKSGACLSTVELFQHFVAVMTGEIARQLTPTLHSQSFCSPEKTRLSCSAFSSSNAFKTPHHLPTHQRSPKLSIEIKIQTRVKPHAPLFLHAKPLFGLTCAR